MSKRIAPAEPDRHTSLNAVSRLNLATSRRGFLQLGLASSIGLTLTSSLVSQSLRAEVKDKKETSQYLFLTAQSATFFTALLPVVLAKHTLAPNTVKAMLLALDDLIIHFNAFNQKQMQQLFDVMAYAPLRFVAGAPWSSWPEATEAEIQAFLVDWRDSRFELKRMGYLSICKVINLCWYARTEAFSDIGYPGPPVKIPTPLTRI